MFRLPSLLGSMALGLGLATALPAAALDLSALSEAERAALRQEIRAYILENPEIIMEAVAVLEERQSQAQADIDKALVASNAAELFADGRSWVGGNPDGDVTLVEFLDYRCGYCRQAFPEVEEMLASDGNIRFVVKEFPVLGEASVLAAKFAIAVRLVAGDEAYKAIHNGMMQFRGEFSTASLRMYAMQNGLDADAIIAAMDRPEVMDEIEANHALASKLKINGTPGFVIGDSLVRGYVPRATMEDLIEAARS